ncbi:MAG TPA: class I SAM-dependent methyltransferase [Acidobacteriaceae bacterium]|nr:class I SAM-dependent methyltransferase [Acidobacteriaceae bacterium]
MITSSVSDSLPPGVAPSMPSFDLVARPYRWMEYLTFGPALHRCRLRFISRLSDRRRALILGDGDGRFASALFAANPQIRADAVDLSPMMLRLLTRRCRAATPNVMERLSTHQADSLNFVRSLPGNARYDLVVTHFFLDCLTQSELESLTQAIAPHLSDGATWLISDFRIPAGRMRFPARVLVRSLYLAFRALTGLRTATLPDHISALSAAGLARTAQQLSLGGILTSELWVSPSNTERAYTPSMLLPPQRHRMEQVDDPVPDPEPASPSLPAPDPGIFHPEPAAEPEKGRPEV